MSRRWHGHTASPPDDTRTDSSCTLQLCVQWSLWVRLHVRVRLRGVGCTPCTLGTGVRGAGTRCLR